MVTPEQLEAALQAWRDAVGTGTVARMLAALEAAEKAAAWQEAHVTSADFVSDDTRDENDERPEGCYVTVRMPLNTKIRAGIARVILPAPAMKEKSDVYRSTR